MNDNRLIVGLGNPGRQYARTRHNAGFMAVDALAHRWGVRWASRSRFRVRLARVPRGGESVWLCQPQTYMNASGEAVAGVATFYRVVPERILVVVDDADLPLGTLRLRPDGRAGGHHGLESVEAHLKTTGYPRLRLGIGRGEGGERAITGHVLQRFTAAEQAVVEQLMERVVSQVECWLSEGIETAMNRFNGRRPDPEEREME